jgi:hypothetical protein
MGSANLHRKRFISGKGKIKGEDLAMSEERLSKRFPRFYAQAGLADEVVRRSVFLPTLVFYSKHCKENDNQQER